VSAPSATLAAHPRRSITTLPPAPPVDTRHDGERIDSGRRAYQGASAGSAGAPAGSGPRRAGRWHLSARRAVDDPLPNSRMIVALVELERVEGDHACLAVAHAGVQQKKEQCLISERQGATVCTGPERHDFRSAERLTQALRHLDPSDFRERSSSYRPSRSGNRAKRCNVSTTTVPPASPPAWAGDCRATGTRRARRGRWQD